MPELPEVETTVRAIAPVLSGLKLKHAVIRNDNLRWKVPREIKTLKNIYIREVLRRAKYILLKTDHAIIMIHLGMSGRLSIINANTTKIPGKHDHVDLIFNHNIILRYTDPRRFGSVLFAKVKDIKKDDGNAGKHSGNASGESVVTFFDGPSLLSHPLLANLGPEPLSKDFSADYLYDVSRNKKAIIKQFIMNQKIVVGVGNIYVNEALFLAEISPLRKSCSLTKKECQKLTQTIKTVLKQAIRKGGTTLRDFLSPEGKLGYFSQKLLVYGRENQPCVKCEQLIQIERNNQRSTFYCSGCQK